VNVLLYDIGPVPRHPPLSALYAEQAQLSTFCSAVRHASSPAQGASPWCDTPNPSPGAGTQYASSAYCLVCIDHDKCLQTISPPRRPNRPPGHRLLATASQIPIAVPKPRMRDTTMLHRKYSAACYIAAVVAEGLRDSGSRGLDAVLPVLMCGLDRPLDRGEMHNACDIGTERRVVDRCAAGVSTKTLQSTCRF
jgi:hypothetical protein